MDTEELSSDTFPDHFRDVGKPKPVTPRIYAVWKSIDPALRKGLILCVKGKTRSASYNRFKSRIIMSPLFEDMSEETIRGVLLHELGHHHSFITRRPYFSSWIAWSSGFSLAASPGGRSSRLTSSPRTMVVAMASPVSYILALSSQHHSLFQKIYVTHPSRQDRYDRLMGLATPVVFHGDSQRGSSFFLGNES